jgi:hypothetical protein
MKLHQNQRSRMTSVLLFASAAALVFHAAAFADTPANPYFAIKVVDEQTGRGVPLVELRTVNNISCYTDSNGLVAFREPGLMGRKVFFFVRSHGYEFPKDGFGFAGTALEVKEGGRAELKIKRINLAERLYRITGAGIYRDSVLLGESTPIREPLLNAEVTGQDSTLVVQFQNKLFWIWGDTGRVRYPLGQFSASGATTVLPGKELDPAKGIDLHYFTDAEGFGRPMCPLPEPGAVWLDGLTVLPGENNAEMMFAHYMRLKDLGKPLEHGLVVWDEKSQTFRKQVTFDLENKWQNPQGHTIHWKDSSQGGAEYLLFASAFASVRVRAEWKSIQDPSAYEAFTCLQPGTHYDKETAKVERDADGKLVYGWKRATDPIAGAEEQELIAAGKIRAEEARHLPRDIDGGKTVRMHLGSIAWNEYRKKWILIAVAMGGTSMLGEVWYSEADSPVGPWRTAKKIITHDKYSFYNPVYHPFFDQDDGRIIYLEGTYASTFSGNENPTPRYDYNQIMYRLDLADPRLFKANQ